MASGPTLPADLLHMLANELCDRLDISTLYSCVASSRQFGSCGAVAALYRICHTLSSREDGADAAAGDQELPVRRLSILWRSLLLSTLGKTLHPYSRHLRSLNLGSFDALLRDDKFRGSRASSDFFSNGLAEFRLVPKLSTRAAQLDIPKTVAKVGNQIVQHAPLLEEISDPVMISVISNPITIQDWAPRLIHLRALEFWDGAVLADEAVRNTLYAHCPQLSTLRIYRCSNDDADSTLAAFITGLPNNSLVEFRNFNDCHVGAETCLALNNHGQSLTTLKLSLFNDGVLSLALLQGCTAVQTLSLECTPAAPDLKATQNDVFLEIVQWLQSCIHLKSVTLQDFISAPDLLTPVFLEGRVKLEKLEVMTMKDAALYVAKDHHDFHQALGRQTSLQELALAAESDMMARDDIEIVTNTLCQLTNLRDLRLTRISDFFNDEQIAQLAEHLPNLEQFVNGGYAISDAVWPSLGKLRKLKLLAFTGMTSFTADGIHSFINGLDEGSTNMTLSMLYADPDKPIDEDVLDTLRQKMAAKVDGRFEYTLLRDPNAQEFDSDDSD